MITQYRFKHAGIIRSHSLSNAIAQAINRHAYEAYHGHEEFPELIETPEGVEVHLGKGYQDTFLGIDGSFNYLRPQQYEAPPEDYTGDDDWLWDEIMEYRKM